MSECIPTGLRVQEVSPWGRGCACLCLRPRVCVCVCLCIPRGVCILGLTFFVKNQMDISAVA